MGCGGSSADVPAAATPTTTAAAPCEEIVGEYLLLKETFVRQESQLESVQVAELKRGSLVTVTEVANLAEKHRVLGRVVVPAGWITLRDTASGVVRASRTMRVPEASTLKAGQALFAMSKLVMRTEEATDSTCVAELLEDEALEVVQVGTGRRIKVKSATGQIGWVSLTTEDGVPILKQDASDKMALEAAAVKIQAVHRGNEARKSLAEAEHPPAAVVHDDAMDAAALKIQAVHRGNEARKTVATKKEETKPAMQSELTETQADITLASALRIVSLNDLPETGPTQESKTNPREVEPMHEQRKPFCGTIMCCHA